MTCMIIEVNPSLQCSVRSSAHGEFQDGGSRTDHSLLTTSTGLLATSSSSLTTSSSLLTTSSSLPTTKPRSHSVPVKPQETGSPGPSTVTHALHSMELTDAKISKQARSVHFMFELCSPESSILDVSVCEKKEKVILKLYRFER